MEKCKVGVMSAVEALASRCKAIGVVRPCEKSFRCILASAIVAGMPSVDAKEMFALVQELKKQIRSLGKEKDRCGKGDLCNLIRQDEL